MASARIEHNSTGIHQILASASPGDAITNVALALRRTLRAAGPSEIFAYHVSRELSGEVLRIADYRVPHSRNLLILHASIGQPEVHEFVVSRREPVVLVYHNVTPARFFEPYDLAFAELLTLGRREVELLRPRVACAIADSTFNARELERMGYRDVRVIPPIMDIRRLTSVEPRASTMHHLADFQAPLLLSVAQLLPHKRPDFLVKSMHIAATYLGMNGFMLLVGHHRLERYARAIREQVRELQLTGVHVVGPVDDADLVAMFRSSSAVVSASEHEGFCIPLVEAMAFERPVLARACAATPETVGDAALLLPPYAGPSLYAEAMCELLANTTLQQDLVERGRRRVAELERATPEAHVLEALLEVA